MEDHQHKTITVIRYILKPVNMHYSIHFIICMTISLPIFLVELPFDNFGPTQCQTLNHGTPQLLVFASNIRAATGFIAGTPGTMNVNLVCHISG